MNKIKQNWKPVTIGGFTGMTMGAATMYFAQPLIADEAGVEQEGLLSTTEDLDSLSFREAFEKARGEIGAGGVFCWRGNLYNTYTAEEWQSMSDDAKEQFAEKVAPQVNHESTSTEQLAGNKNMAEDKMEVSDVKVVEETASDKPDQILASEQVKEVDDDDVRVLGFGEVQLPNGKNVTVQELDYNGQRVAVIDVDQDGTPDYAMSDLNNNRQMDEGEIIDLHTGEALTFTNDDVAQNDMPFGTLDA